MADEISLVTPVFRAAFTKNLFVAQAPLPGSAADAKPKFSVCAIWTPAEFGAEDKARWKAIGEAVNNICVQKFGKPWAELPPMYKRGIRDGSEKEGTDGFGAGTKFATLSSLEAPKISDMQGNPYTLSLGNTGEVFSGCYMFAVVSVYTFDKGVNKGVALGLRSAKKLPRHAERLDYTGRADKILDEATIDEKWLEAQGDAGNDDEIPF